MSKDDPATIPLAAASEEFADEKGEKGEGELAGKRHALIPEVHATVAETDDPSQPTMTFRAIFLGVFFAAGIAAINQYFWFKKNPIQLGQIPVTLLSFFMGKAMQHTLPTTKFKLPILGEVSLNPGPYNAKEHALVTVFANAGYQSAYATDILGIQRLFYKSNWGAAYGILLILTTQIIGYGLAGFCRSILVDPPSMWWPANLPTVALFNALHEKTDKAVGSHARFFAIVATASFVYYFLPGFIMPVLTSLSIMCWFNHSSTIVGNLGSGVAGSGILNFSLDWATITSFNYSPLPYPVFALVNIFIGTAAVAWIIMPAFYYRNLYDAQSFPYISSGGWVLEQQEDGTMTGAPYNVRNILTNLVFDQEKYDAYGQFHLTAFFAFGYAVGFAGLSAVLMHTALYHGKEVWRRWRASRIEDGDIHNDLMEAYKPVPTSYFMILFVVSIALSFVTILYWPTQMPWWALILALVLSFVFTIPTGIIYATTNILPGLNIITEMIIGYLLPGYPIPNVLFKTYGYISQYQAVTILQDLKLAHYMHIPPREVFWAQLWGTIISGIVNYIVMDSIFTNIIHDDDVGVLAKKYGDYTLPNVRVFFTASVVWGVLGPGRVFGVGSLYSALNWGFLVGALLPVPFWYLHTRYPNFGFDNVNFPCMLNALGIMPPATPVNFFTFAWIGLFFNHYIRKRAPKWWDSWNYILSAALDSGTILSALFIALAIILPTGYGTLPYFWFGNPDTDTSGLTVEYCNAI